MKSTKALIAAALAALALIGAGGLASLHFGGAKPAPIPGPAPVPSDPTEALAFFAKQWGPELVKAKATALTAAADAIDAGKSVADSQAIDEATFKAERTKSFDSDVRSWMDRLTPPGTDLADPAKRAAHSRAIRTIAHALDPNQPTGPRPPPAPAPHLFGLSSFAEKPAAVKAMRFPPLSEAAPALFKHDEPKAPAAEPATDEPAEVYLYRAYTEVLGSYPAYPAQQIGDCTSFGTGHALDNEQVIQIALSGGDKSQYREISTEALYGAGRELAGMLGGGDGCYGAPLAKAATDIGTVSREQVGPYSGQRAKQFGRSGIPADLKTKAADHKATGAAKVSSIAEARAALASGYPVVICSNVGFEGSRDSRGVIRARGTWPHCMHVNAYRPGEKAGTTEFLVCQSWGPTMPTGPIAGDMPPNSFWIVERDMQRVLDADDSHAISGYGPFVKKTLPERWTNSGYAKPLRKAG